ncbi:MAG: hypothetical protein V1844_27030 [Pseudomonadota bacterium]
MIQVPKQRDVRLNRTSVLKGMEEAWLDHRHCRDQTWHSVAATVALAAGFVTLQLTDPLTIALAGCFVLAAAFSGMLITKHHREYEIRKFTHIMQCEYWLRLRDFRMRQDKKGFELRPDKKDYISGSGLLHWATDPETTPRDILFLHMFLPWKQNTPLFIIRVHAAIYTFTLLYLRHSIQVWGSRIAVSAGLIALAWIVVADFSTWKEGQSEPNQASEATSEPAAPDADSSAPIG